MSKCETVIFSDKAYNAIIRESFAKHPVETGGILLGYILDTMWIVMEVIPPGFNGIFEPAYFEPDQDFVNYLSLSVANQYKVPLELLGLWHRHPGSMNYFSSTDDRTNSEYASKNPHGAISGLVNVDPSFRLTMYHLDNNKGNSPKNVAYSSVDIIVGDNYIEDELFALRYVDELRSELHPTPTCVNTRVAQTRSVPKSSRNGGGYEIAEQTISEVFKQPSAPTTASVNYRQKQKSRKWLLLIIAVAVFLIGAFVGVMTAPLFESPETTKTEQVSGKERYKRYEEDKEDKGKKLDAKINDKGNKGGANPSKP